MLKNIKDRKETRDALLSLLPTCGTLSGIAVALVGVIKLSPTNGSAATIADDFLLFSAMGFLISCYLIFFALRIEKDRLREKLLQLIDIVFLGALTMIVLTGFIVVYELM